MNLKRKARYILTFCAFPFVCIIVYFSFYIAPNSTELKAVTTITDFVTRIDYINLGGELTVASDKGYATIVKELDENGHSIRESYYDEYGRAVPASLGQYAIQREWSGDYNIKITSLDISGQPAYNKSGYVSKIQKFNGNGKIIAEFYLNIKDESVANRHGEYGKSFEYDIEGRKYKITSLDENENPKMNTSGYCYVIKTYYADNSVNTEMYYDTEGKPVKLSDGQYGLKHIGSQTVKIDINGNKIFSINELLKEYFWLIGACGTILVIAIILLPQSWRLAVFSLYILFILYETLITRENGGNLELTLFWSYRQFFTSYNLRLEILNNIWLFVPFGAGLYSLLYKCQLLKADKEGKLHGENTEKKAAKPRIAVILVAMIFSIIIEASQYIFSLGLCEIDDVISNTLGAAIGVMMAASLLEIKESIRKRKNVSVINPNQVVH